MFKKWQFANMCKFRVALNTSILAVEKINNGALKNIESQLHGNLYDNSLYC